MSAEETLKQIAGEVAVCTNCILHKTRKKSVPGEGPANSEIMFIGEGPGMNENEQGRPFVGAAGNFLNQLLAQAGLKRETVWIGNVVKCRPPENRDPQPDELAACNTYLERQIEAIDPRIIVTLGRFSMGKFMPGAKISAIHGQMRKIGNRFVIAMYPSSRGAAPARPDEDHHGGFRQAAAAVGCGSQGTGKIRTCSGNG